MRLAFAGGVGAVAAGLARLALRVVAPAVAVYCLLLLAFWMAGVRLLAVIRDPGQVTGQAVHVGFLSNLGVFLWIATGTICLFTAAATAAIPEVRRERRLLGLGGLLSLLLGLDDFFMIHDLFVPQIVCFLVYALIAGAILRLLIGELRAVDPLPFLLAGTLLATSMVVDYATPFLPLGYTAAQIFEEALKFAGIVSWLAFWAQVASATLRRLRGAGDVATSRPQGPGAAQADSP